MKINLGKFCCLCLLLLMNLSFSSAWTVEDLMHRIAVCSAPVDVGSCSAHSRKWYYAARLKKCQSFIYSGCGGNKNRFYSKIECEDYCEI